MEDQREETFNSPDKELLQIKDMWIMYFDGAPNQKGFGVGILLVSLE